MMAFVLHRSHSVFSAGLTSMKYPLASSRTPGSSFGLVQDKDKVVLVESVTLRSITLPGGSDRRLRRKHLHKKTWKEK